MLVIILIMILTAHAMLMFTPFTILHDCRTCLAPGVKKGTLVRTDILEPMDFTVVVTRNLTPQQSLFFPEVNVVLDLDQNVKVSTGGFHSHLLSTPYIQSVLPGIRRHPSPYHYCAGYY